MTGSPRGWEPLDWRLVCPESGPGSSSGCRSALTEGSPPGRPSKQKEGTPEGGRRFRGASLERARANEPPDERNLAGEKDHGQPLRSRDRMRQTSSLLPAPHGDLPRQELARAPVRA